MQKNESRTLYPLTPGQRLIFLAWKYTLSKQVMNIPTSCLVQAPLDMAVLRLSVEQAIARSDSFGVRITKAGKERMQYFADRKALLIEEADFSSGTQAEMEAFFAKAGQRRMKLDDSPLARIYLVRAPNGHCGLFTVFSHLMVDSWGIGVFYKDVLSLYYAIKDGTPLPPAPGSFEKFIQREMEYAKSERCEKDRAFWENELASIPEIPTYSHVNGSAMLDKVRRRKKDPEYRFGPAFFLRTKGAQVVIPVSKEDVDQMVAFCREHAVASPAQLFIMGMRTYLAKVNGRPRSICMFSMLHRRSSLEEKRTSGFRVHNLPLPVYMSEDVTFIDALTAIMDKQNLYYRHADYEPISVMALQHKIWQYKRAESVNGVGFTFQPMQMDLGNGVKISSKWYCNGTSPQQCYLTIMDGDGTGGLRCYYEYNTSTVKPETLERCHAYIMKVIRTGLANPAITLKALMDLPLAERVGEPERLEPVLG